MIDFSQIDLTSWHWSIIGLVLLIIELFFPGAFFIWIGFSALITAALTYVLGLTFASQAICFMIACILCVTIGARIYKKLKVSKEASILNRKSDQMVGLVFTLNEPIINGSGHVQIGGSYWRIIGQDLPTGTEVRIEKIEGNSLVVKAIINTP